MKKLFIVLGVLVVAVLSLGTYAVMADSPHFISGVANLDGAGNLTASFKEVGLGTTFTTEHIVLSANESAVYACINGGDNHPQAANKITVQSLVNANGDFPVRNGETTGSLTLPILGSGTFACPSGQSLVLVSVSYTSVLIHDDTSGASVVLDDMSKVFLTLTS